MIKSSLKYENLQIFIVDFSQSALRVPVDVVSMQFTCTFTHVYSVARFQRNRSFWFLSRARSLFIPRTFSIAFRSTVQLTVSLRLRIGSDFRTVSMSWPRLRDFLMILTLCQRRFVLLRCLRYNDTRRCIWSVLRTNLSVDSTHMSVVFSSSIFFVSSTLEKNHIKSFLDRYLRLISLSFVMEELLSFIDHRSRFQNMTLLIVVQHSSHFLAWSFQAHLRDSATCPEYWTNRCPESDVESFTPDVMSPPTDFGVSLAFLRNTNDTIAWPLRCALFLRSSL